MQPFAGCFFFLLKGLIVITFVALGIFGTFCNKSKWKLTRSGLPVALRLRTIWHQMRVGTVPPKQSILAENHKTVLRQINFKLVKPHSSDTKSLRPSFFSDVSLWPCVLRENTIYTLVSKVAASARNSCYKKWDSVFVHRFSASHFICARFVETTGQTSTKLGQLHTS